MEFEENVNYSDPKEVIYVNGEIINMKRLKVLTYDGTYSDIGWDIYILGAGRFLDVQWSNFQGVSTICNILTLEECRELVIKRIDAKHKRRLAKALNKLNFKAYKEVDDETLHRRCQEVLKKTTDRGLLLQIATLLSVKF